MASLTCMRRSNFIMKPGILIAVLSFVAAAPCLAQSEVASITVKSKWVSFVEPHSSELTVMRKTEHFYAASTRLPDETVQSFIAAVESPLRSGKKLEDVGLASDWLSKNADAAVKEYVQRNRFNPPSPAQQELFRVSFANAESLAEMLSYQEPVDTLDDFAEITIQIAMANGDHYSLKSTGDPDFLGAWLV